LGLSSGTKNILNPKLCFKKVSKKITKENKINVRKQKFEIKNGY